MPLVEISGHKMMMSTKPATVRRYVATIARAHLAAGFTSPCASEPVRLSLKEMGQKRARHETEIYALLAPTQLSEGKK